jgi:hypothetical protein
MGIFILLIILLALIAGELRKELALTLTGAVFLAVWVYCFSMTLLLALLHRKRAFGLSCRISPGKISAGDTAELFFIQGGGTTGGSADGHSPAKRGGRFIRLPGILIRYRVALRTKDGRLIQRDFDPDFAGGARTASKHGGRLFPVPLRGAWFSSYDELAVFDALGFFRFNFRLPQEAGPRILSGPGSASNALPVHVRSGGSERRSELHYQRTDNLVEHRPYVPGDDPRRINWKLYGHGGELFVREGESEPPPHSHILIVIDTEADAYFYTKEAARNAVDMLCENALAAALVCAGSGMDVLVGFTEGACAGPSPAGSHLGVFGGNQAELAAALALPAALPLHEPERKRWKRSPAVYPVPLDDRGLLILALPRRAGGETSALDLFIKNRDPKKNAELFFLCTETADAGKKRGAYSTTVSLEAEAKSCAAFYGRCPNISAGYCAGDYEA